MSPRRYLMCRPTYFAVDYVINPWMDPTRPGRHRRSRSGSGRPCATPTSSLGHTVEEIEPIPGLPDMVFAANGATVDRRHRLRRPVPLPAARRRGAGLPGLVRRRRLRDARGQAGQRGRGRPAARPSSSCSPAPASAPTWPRTPRRRSCSAARSSRCSWSTRATTTSTPRCAVLGAHHRVPARGVQRRPASGAGPAVPGRDPRRRWPTPRCSASTRSATARTWCCRCRPRGWPPGARARSGARTGGRVRAAQGRRRPEVLHAGAAGARDGPHRTDAWSPRPSGTPRTTTTRCRSSSPTPRAPG